jgi:hypothetical protein
MPSAMVNSSSVEEAWLWKLSCCLRMNSAASLLASRESALAAPLEEVVVVAGAVGSSGAASSRSSASMPGASGGSLERGCLILGVWSAIGELIDEEAPRVGAGLGLAVLGGGASALEIPLNLVPFWTRVALFFPQSVMLWRAVVICSVEADRWLAELACWSSFLIAAAVRPFKPFAPLAISLRMMPRIVRWRDVVAPLEDSSSMLKSKCRFVGSGELEVPIGGAVEVGDDGIAMCWLTESRSWRSGSVAGLERVGFFVEVVRDEGVEQKGTRVLYMAPVATVLGSQRSASRFATSARGVLCTVGADYPDRSPSHQSFDFAIANREQ